MLLKKSLVNQEIRYNTYGRTFIQHTHIYKLKLLKKILMEKQMTHYLR